MSFCIHEDPETGKICIQYAMNYLIQLLPDDSYTKTRAINEKYSRHCELYRHQMTDRESIVNGLTEIFTKTNSVVTFPFDEKALTLDAPVNESIIRDFVMRGTEPEGTDLECLIHLIRNLNEVINNIYNRKRGGNSRGRGRVRGRGRGRVRYRGRGRARGYHRTREQLVSFIDEESSDH